jgi:two-component system cell cycle response regulator
MSARVLVVDDVPANVKLLEARLSAEYFDVLTASSGAEALAVCARAECDIILLDVMMPDMDGFEVCRRLRAAPLIAQVPVIMVTALDDRQSRLQGIEAGADDFVSKPYDRAELRARVRTITRLNRYRRLLAERAKFEWAVDRSNDGYLILDERGAVLYANSQARLYLGLPMDEHASVPGAFLDIVRKQYRCEPEEAWAVWTETARPQPHYLVRPESPTAKSFWLQVDALDLPAAAGGGRVVQVRDVTTQMVLQRNAWEFQSLVSHKLRTPLTSALTSLELLAQSLPESVDAEMIQLLDIALHGAQRLRSEIAGIVEYLDAPRLAESGGCLRVSQLPAIIAMISADLDLRTVTTTVREDVGDPQLVLPQPAIGLALGELLENAIKFHPCHTPTIQVTVSRLNPAMVNVQVGDDGLTLSPEQLARAWSPYYQGEKYFTGQATGMGLGLSMVATLVWGVGGACRIHNRSEAPGVVVELDFPCAE